MGNFYVNYTLRGPTPAAVAAALGGRSAIVTPAKDGCVVVFDEESDDQNEDVISDLGSRLSRECGCAVLAVINHDDDILAYQLYLDGGLVDEYDSSPGYFDSAADPSKPAGGDARQLCQAFGSNRVADVENLLRRSSFGDDGYLFAVERHGDLVSALGIPAFAVGVNFADLDSGELPEGLDEDDLVRVE